MRRLRIILAVYLTAFAAPVAADEATMGELLYIRNCASCHGLTGRGDGPMTAILNLPLPDLTGLSAENGGDFPMLRVVSTIDGRTEYRGHGGPMPVFGELLGKNSAVIDGPENSVLQTRGAVLSLAYYLESIQN